MTALTGRTHAKYIQVFIDNAAGTLTEITSYVNNIGTVGVSYDKQDVTAYSDGTKNIVIGQGSAPLTIGGPFDTVWHAIAIVLNGRQTPPLAFDIRIGVRAVWESGAPQFGISGIAANTQGYLMHSYSVDMAANTWSAQLDVFGPVAPAWGTAAET